MVTKNGTELWKLGIQLVSVVVLVVSVVALLLLTGKDVSIEQVLLLAAAGAAIAGLAVPRLGGGGGAAAAGAVLLALSVLGSGCGGGVQVDPTTCVGAVLRCAADVTPACWPRIEPGEAEPPGAAETNE